MDAKEYLQRYGDAMARVEELKARRDELLSLAASSSGVDMATVNGERVILPKVRGGAGGRGGRVERFAIEAADIATEIDERLAECLELMEQTVDTIEHVDNFDQRMVLTLRYIKRMKWADIVEYFQSFDPCSEQTVYNHHGRGLVAVDELLQNLQ